MRREKSTQASLDCRLEHVYENKCARFDVQYVERGNSTSKLKAIIPIKNGLRTFRASIFYIIIGWLSLYYSGTVVVYLKLLVT